MGRIEGWTVGYHSHYRDYQLWKELMCLFDTFDWGEGDNRNDTVGLDRLAGPGRTDMPPIVWQVSG